MKDLNFREGDAKTSIFGSNEMIETITGRSYSRCTYNTRDRIPNG